MDNAAFPLDARRGGPLVCNMREIKKIVNGAACPLSYVKGMVANEQSIAAMGGHHADPKVPDGLPHSMLVCDEASSVPSEYYQVALPWAKRVLVFGNTWSCENFFRKAVDGGNIVVHEAGKEMDAEPIPTILGEG